MARRKLTRAQLRAIFAKAKNKAGQGIGLARRNPRAALAIGGGALGVGKLIAEIVSRFRKRGRKQQRLSNTVVESESRRLGRGLSKGEVKSVRKSVSRDFGKFLAPDIRRRARLDVQGLDTSSSTGNRKRADIRRLSVNTQKKLKRRGKRLLLGGSI